MANKQGKKFIKNRNKINILNMEKSIEGFSNAKLKSIKNRVNALEDNFNNKLNEYESTYKLYMEELLKQDKSLNNKYKNKIIKVNGKKYFVTKHGVYKKYNNYGWVNRDQGCPNEIINADSSVLDNLKDGGYMAKGQLCMSGGINIENEDGEVAWLDIYGRKHVYKNFINKHRTCSNHTYQIPNDKYNAYVESGRKWGSNDRCEIISFDNDKSLKLIRLNEELFNIIKQIKLESDKINNDNMLSNDMIAKGELIKVRSQLLNERKILKKLKNQSDTNMAVIEKNIYKVNNIKLYHNLLAGTSIIALFYLLNKII